MRNLSKWALVALMAAVPSSLIACGGDEDDDTPGTGGSSGKGGSGGSAGISKGGSSGSAGKGGSSGNAGKGGSSGSAGKGGSSGNAGTSGSAGADGGVGNEGGTSGSNAGGTGNEGGTDVVIGGAGAGSGPDPECDLSGEGKDREALPTEITDELTLDSNIVYELNGMVKIRDGGKLIIPACTRIEGSPAPDPGVLVTLRGGKLEANGTKDAPVLFTSQSTPGNRVAGQWGGVVLLGNAGITRAAEAREGQYEGITDPDFTYGGEDDEDSSGSLTYVRIEFGGWEIVADKEINGLSMAGVGSGTTIHHVMVSNTQDDCFEWWGGTVTADHLVCNNAGDDNFDSDEGYRGGGQYWFGRRAQWAISSEDPTGFEQDSINDGSAPRSEWSYSNVTLCGPGESSGRTSAHYGMVLRELVTGSIADLALTGFEYGIDTRDTFADGDVTITNSSAWELLSAIGDADATDDDAAFDDGSIFSDEPSNTLEPDPVPYTTEDCLNGGDAPAAAVLQSDTGAFADGAEWLEGAWVDWSED